MTLPTIPDHGLSPRQVELIRSVMTPFATSIRRVGLFGSRAKGTQRPASDIDLVLYGPVDQRTQDRISTLFSESSLPFKVDVVAYGLITHPPLKDHIDAAGVPFLSFESVEVSP